MEHTGHNNRRWSSEHWGWILVVVLGLITVVFLPLYSRIGCISEKECHEREHAGRLVCVQLAGGLLAAYGLLLAVQRIQQTRIDQARKEKEERVARYIRSVTLLGSMRDGDNKCKEANVESRLGAVRALRSLWLEAESEFGYVLDTLNDYVAENLRRRPVAFEPNNLEERPPSAWRSLHDGGVRPDVRAARTVLLEARYCVRFENTFLDEIDLKHGLLTKARFTRCRLRSAVLESALLDGADFRYADLGGATLFGADLTNADLRDAELAGVLLDGADLSGTIFWQSKKDETETSNGLTPETVMRAKNWRAAKYSPGFREELERKAAETGESA